MNERPAVLHEQSGEPNHHNQERIVMAEDDQNTKWHLDKRVPLALILAILVQTAGAMWWAATISERVTVLERTSQARSAQAERIASIEATITAIREGVAEIKMILNRRQ